MHEGDYPLPARITDAENQLTPGTEINFSTRQFRRISEDEPKFYDCVTANLYREEYHNLLTGIVLRFDSFNRRVLVKTAKRKGWVPIAQVWCTTGQSYLTDDELEEEEVPWVDWSK